MERAGHSVGMRFPPVAQAVAGHGENPRLPGWPVSPRPAKGQRALQRVADGVLGRGLVLVDNAEVDDDLVRDMTEILTSMCARLYGKRAAREPRQTRPCGRCD